MRHLAASLLAVQLCACAPFPGPGPDGGPTADAGGSDAGRDGGVDAGTADGGLALAQACTVLNARRCEALRRCGLIGPEDSATRACLAWLGATWCGPSRWPSRTNPLVNTLRYDAVLAQACADALAQGACADLAELPAACTRFLLPNAYSRQACYDGYQECTEGVCRGAACPRSCQPRGLAGEVCRVDGDCRTGLFCRISNTAAGIGLCTAYGQSGATCDVQAPCLTGLACVGGTCILPPSAGQPCPALVCEDTAWCTTTPDGGFCAGKRNAGAPCTDDVQCLAGLLCDPLRALCEPLLLTQVQEPCSLRQACPAGTACLGATTAQLGACGAPRAEGEPCQASRECLAHLACIEASDAGRVCGSRARNGSLCSDDRDCLVLSRCVQGVCVALPQTGEGCAAQGTCLWGPCLAQGDGGSTCVDPLGPGAACRTHQDCASEQCSAGRCLATCAP